MEDTDVSQKVMSGLYGRGTYSIREVDYSLLTHACCAGQYDAARLLQMEELDAAAMIDKIAGQDHGVYETLTLGPLTSTEDFVADDAKYIYMLQGQQQSRIMERLLVFFLSNYCVPRLKLRFSPLKGLTAGLAASVARIEKRLQVAEEQVRHSFPGPKRADEEVAKSGRRACSNIPSVVTDEIIAEMKTMIARDPMTILSTKTSLKDHVFTYNNILQATGETIAQKKYDGLFESGAAQQAMREQTPPGGVRLCYFP